MPTKAINFKIKRWTEGCPPYELRSPRMPDKKISSEELLACLQRSGYLLESRIVRDLDGRGFFVEPNQVLQDPRTGKSREIDFVAEYNSYEPKHENVCVKTHFVGEVVNNRFPIVLMTSRPSTPNSDFESYVKFGLTPERAPFYSALNIYEEKGPPQDLLFSQYCAIAPKRGDGQELMASHPEDLYSSLQKLSEYTEQQVDEFEDWASESQSDFWRAYYWHPMLVVGGELYAVTVDCDSQPQVRPTTSAFLEFNWHQANERKTTVIEVVQIDSLVDRMLAVVELDQAAEERVTALKHKAMSRATRESP